MAVPPKMKVDFAGKEGVGGGVRSPSSFEEESSCSLAEAASRASLMALSLTSLCSTNVSKWVTREAP